MFKILRTKLGQKQIWGLHSLLSFLLIISILTASCTQDMKSTEQEQNVASATTTDTAAKEEVLTMGFVPLKDSEKMVENLKPLEEALSKILKREVKSYIASNYVGIVTALSSNKIDFAFIPPFAYILAAQNNEVEPHLVALNKKGEAGYTSTIYVNKDSKIKKITDLKDKKVAFVDFSSTSGYIFPAALLAENKMVQNRDFQAVLSGGHDKSLQALLDNNVEAAAVFTEAPIRFSKDFPEFKTAFSPLVTTKKIPGITLVTQKKLSKNIEAKEIVEAIKVLSEQDEGKELFKELFGFYGFQTINSEDFAVVKDAATALDIDLLKVAK